MQQLRRRQRADSKFIALIPSRSILQMLAFFFLEWNSKSLYRSSKKETDSRCLVLTVSTKREMRHFYVEVM